VRVWPFVLAGAFLFYTLIGHGQLHTCGCGLWAHQPPQTWQVTALLGHSVLAWAAVAIGFLRLLRGGRPVEGPPGAPDELPVAPKKPQPRPPAPPAARGSACAAPSRVLDPRVPETG
jgi:hypothetical protein